MPQPSRVLVVAHRTATTPALIDAVRERAAGGHAEFHLVVPASAHGLHRLVNPEDEGSDEARHVLEEALPALRAETGAEVTGAVGDHDPLCAIQDAINLGSFDEIIVSTLPRRMSRWLRLDLVSKARGLGLPVTHVEAQVGDEETAATG